MVPGRPLSDLLNKKTPADEAAGVSGFHTLIR
jgi:hypothetical protein